MTEIFNLKQLIKDITENIEAKGNQFVNGNIFSISQKDIENFITEVKAEIDAEELKKQDTYPPTEVNYVDNYLSILMALPGYSETQISINVIDDELIITGTPSEKIIEIASSYKNIVIRPFKKSFKISSTSEVQARFKNSLLEVFALDNPAPISYSVKINEY